MTPEEIIDLAKDFRQCYNTNDAIEVANSIGINVIMRKQNTDDFKAHIVKFDKYTPFICVNENFSPVSRNVLCAHELGHAILHEDTIYNQFDTSTDMIKQKQEYEANLFAVAFLCDEDVFNMPFSQMNNYVLKRILDENIYV